MIFLLLHNIDFHYYVYTLKKSSFLNHPFCHNILECNDHRIFELLVVQTLLFHLQLYQHMPEVQITDDAMVVETMLQTPVKLYEGSYNNIKITTPEDLVIAESFLHV